MSDIDWSKAPPHATHWCPGNAKIEAGWIYNPGGNGGEFYSCYADKGLEHIPEFPEWRKLRLVPRPSKTSWTGEGLPPVRTVCEVLNRGLHNPAWEECTILFCGKHRILYDSESCCERVAFIQDLEFRQIRTPEQIATEEREHELNRMVATVSMLDKGWARKVCAGLYDAGYRKFEIVDEWRLGLI